MYKPLFGAGIIRIDPGIVESSQDSKYSRIMSMKNQSCGSLRPAIGLLQFKPCMAFYAQFLTYYIIMLLSSVQKVAYYAQY